MFEHVPKQVANPAGHAFDKPECIIIQKHAIRRNRLIDSPARLPETGSAPRRRAGAAPAKALVHLAL